MDSHTPSTAANSMASSSPFLASLAAEATILSTSPLVRASSRRVSTRSCLPTPSFRLLLAQSSFNSTAVFSSSSTFFFSRASLTFTPYAWAFSWSSASCFSKLSTMANLLEGSRPLLITRCFNSSMLRDFNLFFLAAAASSCRPIAKRASTNSSFFPVGSWPLSDNCFLSSSTDMALNSFLLLAAASSSCFLSSCSLFRFASFANRASTMSTVLPFFEPALSSSTSSSGFGLAKRPSSPSFLTMRSTITSFTRGSTPADVQSRRRAALSIDANCCSLASRAFLAMALTTPSSSIHLFISNSTRACFVMGPFAPAASHSSLSSGTERPSSSSFLPTTTSRISACLARSFARTSASCASTASTMSSFLPVSRPLLWTSSLRSFTGIAFNSFFLSAFSSASL
mmetsp:Transcript_3394/g.9161  ORF Transcript_3394/g.9161 Transcript_3394/m.9161 type:complete len:399 (-) Transcript_3394:115-1311(-)